MINTCMLIIMSLFDRHAYIFCFLQHYETLKRCIQEERDRAEEQRILELRRSDSIWTYQ